MPKNPSRKTASTPPVTSEARDAAAQPLPDGDFTRSVSMDSEPSEADIRLRAYHRYLERGQQPGTDFDDWLAAERDLYSERAVRSGQDPDAGKGAVEGDRPTDYQQGNRQGTGVDSRGLPSDPVATAQDATGARVDQTQG